MLMKRRLGVVLVIGFLLISSGSVASVSNEDFTVSFELNSVQVTEQVETLSLELTDTINTRYIDSGEPLSVDITAESSETGEISNSDYTYQLEDDGRVNFRRTIHLDEFDNSDFPDKQQTDLQVKIKLNHPDMQEQVRTSTVSINRQIDNTSCKTILESDSSKSSGFYEIQPDGVSSSFEVYCEMSEDGGGWIKLETTNDQPYVSGGWGYFDKPPSYAEPTPDLTLYDHVSGSISQYQYTRACPGETTVDVKYQNPETGEIYDRSEVDAIRNVVSSLSANTRQVTFSADDDGDPTQHEAYVNGFHMTPFKSANEEFTYGIWGMTDSETTIVSSYYGQSISSTLPSDGDNLVPDTVTFTCEDSQSSGGAVSWGYEKGYALVK